MSSPLISVVTVVYNAADVVEETIKSVLCQTYPNIEYIVIDGGSTDGTLEIIKKYEDHIHYFVSEKDSGIYDAMNKGIIQASGEWINFMNAGDRFYTSRVLEEIFLRKEYPGASVVYGDTEVEYDKRYRKRVSTPIIKEYYTLFNHQAAFTRLSLIKKNLFDTHFRISADEDFFRKIYHQGVKFHRVETLVNTYNLEGISEKMIFRRLREQYFIGKKYDSSFIVKFLPKCILILVKRLIRCSLPASLANRIRSKL